MMGTNLYVACTFTRTMYKFKVAKIMKIYNLSLIGSHFIDGRQEINKNEGKIIDRTE